MRRDETRREAKVGPMKLARKLVAGGRPRRGHSRAKPSQAAGLFADLRSVDRTNWFDVLARRTLLLNSALKTPSKANLIPPQTCRRHKLQEKKFTGKGRKFEQDKHAFWRQKCFETKKG